MRLFLNKTLFFLGVLGVIYLGILSTAGGFTDPFYRRFTTNRQQNIILGTSRVAQGIQPKCLEETLGKPFFNFGFTLTHSPYGPTYFNAIEKKLDKSSKDGIFIIGVDPWALALRKAKDSTKSPMLPEENLVLGKLNSFNSNPNLEYLLFCLEDNQFFTFTKQIANSLFFNFKSKENEWPYKLASEKVKKSIDLQTKLFLHDDGWLEVDVTQDSMILQKKLKEKVKEYKAQLLPHHEFSELRLHYLLKTINLLKSHGKVYMVRLPVHMEMHQIDSLLSPSFNSSIKPATEIVDGYLDLSSLNDQMQYTDGNHLTRGSGLLVSKQIANWIADKSK